MRTDGEREVRELQPIRNGMFVCEFEGNLSKPECERRLRSSISPFCDHCFNNECTKVQNPRCLRVRKSVTRVRECWKGTCD